MRLPGPKFVSLLSLSCTPSDGLSERHQSARKCEEANRLTSRVPLDDRSFPRAKTHAHFGRYPSHAPRSSKLGAILSRTEPPMRTLSGPLFRPAQAWSNRAEIFEHALEQPKQSFSVPEKWMPIAPAPVSAIAIGLYIVCGGFPGFGHSAGQKSWDSSSRRNGCNDQLDRSRLFCARRGQKTGWYNRFAVNESGDPAEPRRCTRRSANGI
jgi:hypothetical protein